jgi:sugar/nucleoside kinase (ribokinase family)
MDIVGPVLETAAVLLPGEAELRLLSGKQDIKSSVDSLFRNPGLEMIVLKLGKEGATIFMRDAAIKTPAYSVQEVDPTGAGDCFDAGFLCGLLEGKSLEDSGKLAATAGALNAAAFGPMEGKISPQSIRELVSS